MTSAKLNSQDSLKTTVKHARIKGLKLCCFRLKSKVLRSEQHIELSQLGFTKNIIYTSLLFHKIRHSSSAFPFRPTEVKARKLFPGSLDSGANLMKKNLNFKKLS